MRREGAEGAGDGLGRIFYHGAVRGRLLCQQRLDVGEIGLAQIAMSSVVALQSWACWDCLLRNRSQT